MEREKLRKLAQKDKHRDLAMKFEKAEQIRNGHKALQHAKFFHQQLKVLSVQEGKQSRLMQLTGALENINKRIEDLESTETNMLEKLQRSINEHNQLLSKHRLGNLDKEDKKRIDDRGFNSTNGFK